MRHPCSRHEVPGATSTAAGPHIPRRRAAARRSPIRREHVVVLSRVAERAGHAAASGVENRRPRTTGCGTEARGSGGRQAHRLLMAVAVEQHGSRGLKVSSSRRRPALPFLLEVLLEQHARVRDAARPCAGRPPRSKAVRIFANRRQAARLEETRCASAARGRVVQRVGN